MKVVEVYCQEEKFNPRLNCTVSGAWIAVYDNGIELAICRDYEASSAKEALAILSKSVSMREVRSQQTSRFFHTHRRKERGDSMTEPLYKFNCEVEGVELDCLLEYEPKELNHGEAPDFPACMNLVNAFCGDIDIAHLLMQSIVGHICEEALTQFNSESE